MTEKRETINRLSKFPSKQDVINYLYDDDAVFMKIRDGDYSKPEGNEILLEYAKNIVEKMKKEESDKEIVTDLVFALDVIYTLMEFPEAEWTSEIASEMRQIIVK